MTRKEKACSRSSIVSSVCANTLDLRDEMVKCSGDSSRLRGDREAKEGSSSSTRESAKKTKSDANGARDGVRAREMLATQEVKVAASQKRVRHLEDAIRRNAKNKVCTRLLSGSWQKSFPLESVASSRGEAAARESRIGRRTAQTVASRKGPSTERQKSTVREVLNVMCCTVSKQRLLQLSRLLCPHHSCPSTYTLEWSHVGIS